MKGFITQVHNWSLCMNVSLSKFYFSCFIGAIGVAMVEIDAETIIEMEVVVLGLIGVIIMEIVLVHTESLDIERFMYYELWAEGLIISVGWFLKMEAKR